MKTRIAAIALGLAALSLMAAPAEAAGKCVKTGGTGTGVVEGFASFMANAAAKNAAKAWGGDAVKITKISEKCAFETLTFNCTVAVKACK